MIKGVLFDFDGTIVESEESRFLAINKTLESFNVEIIRKEWNNEYKKMNTTPIFQNLIDKNNINANAIDLYHKSHILRREIIKVCGVNIVKDFMKFYEFLKSKKIEMIICSGGKRSFVENLLNHIKLDMDFLGREDYNEVKPKPDAFLKGLEKLGLQKNEVLVFDDTFNGVKSAVDGGFKNIIAINSTMSSDDLKLFGVISNIKDYSELDFDEIIGL